MISQVRYRQSITFSYHSIVFNIRRFRCLRGAVFSLRIFQVQTNRVVSAKPKAACQQTGYAGIHRLSSAWIPESALVLSLSSL